MKAYNIIYSNEAFAPYVNALAEALTAKGDAKFEAKLDTACAPGEFEILVGDTNREESAAVGFQKPLYYEAKTVNGKLVIKTGGEHSLNKFLTSLAEVDIETILSDKDCDMVGNYFDDPYDISRPEGTDIRIMTANVMANVPTYDGGALLEHGFRFERRAEIFHAALDYYTPDIVGVQEFCMSCHAELEKYHDADKWEILKFLNPHPQYASDYVYSTIMYRTDLMTLLDSGMKYYDVSNNNRCRCITWGIFRIKATGKEFGFISTHWDGFDKENSWAQMREISAFTNEMMQTKGIPVFTMGDLNSNEWTKSLPQYFQNIDSYDCMHADESKRLNIAGSWHGWAVPKASAGSCDHITAPKKDCEILKFETLMYNEQIYSSDHAWLAVDIKFKK